MYTRLEAALDGSTISGDNKVIIDDALSVLKEDSLRDK